MEAPPPDDIMRVEREAPPPDDIVSNESEAPPLDDIMTIEREAPPPDDTMRNDFDEEEEEHKGTNFLSVSDVVQQEDVSVVELDGGPSPPLVVYQGPVFPP
ncbi:protein TALPID3-like, partial [Etheostoma cragini]|uniref:protein TALPID3-like n=1 Tax=Etheostoma cragini TaxID=417921 RepID=UPI00155E11AE